MTRKDIFAGESRNMEFKVSRPEKSKNYMKTVVAFANGKGGSIVFGVEDKTREIVGIPEESIFSEIDAITSAISDSCEPVIVPDIYPQTIDGKNVIVVEISSGKQKPYYIKAEGITDGVYMRVSGTSRKADREMTQEMYYDSEGRSYDMVIRRDKIVSDQDIKELCSQMKKVALENCKNDVQRREVKDMTKNRLMTWGILAEDEDGTIHPTNAYIFLTGQDVFLSKIQCGMFKGTTRAVFVDKRDYDGPVWRQIEEAHQFVLRNIHLGAKIEGVYRKDIYELPPDSLRELIINAVVNCSFLQSSHVQVAIYDDRLEITSPGGLMPGVTIDRMKEGYSQIRNKALANAFSYMHLIEGWGTGIPRLLQDMKDYGLAEPEFIDMEIALRINLYRGNVAVENVGKTGKKTKTSRETSTENEETSGETSRETNSESEETSGETSTENEETSRESGAETKRGNKTTTERVIEEIKNNPSVTQKQLAERIGLSYAGIRYVMKKLQEEGTLERIGSTKKGRWIIKA